MDCARVIRDTFFFFVILTKLHSPHFSLNRRIASHLANFWLCLSANLSWCGLSALSTRISIWFNLTRRVRERPTRLTSCATVQFQSRWNLRPPFPSKNDEKFILYVLLDVTWGVQHTKKLQGPLKVRSNEECLFAFLWNNNQAMKIVQRSKWTFPISYKISL